MSIHENQDPDEKASSLEAANSTPWIRTVFLDRDGTINRKAPEGSYVGSWDKFHLLPGVEKAISKLNRAGIRVLVVTNQRGVALGLYTMADVEAIHAQLQKELYRADAHIDGFYVCPHDKSACDCRKPLPGLFQQAVRDFPEIQADSSAIVGDSPSDIEFGKRVGMKTVLIRSDVRDPLSGSDRPIQSADYDCPSLSRAVDLLVAPR
jgi:D-glycero-D-manno-heptose 1,7-bisphosphate phosphatase